jgi:hypothetical protein
VWSTAKRRPHTTKNRSKTTKNDQKRQKTTKNDGNECQSRPRSHEKSIKDHTNCQRRLPIECGAAWLSLCGSVDGRSGQKHSKTDKNRPKTQYRRSQEISFVQSISQTTGKISLTRVRHHCSPLFGSQRGGSSMHTHLLYLVGHFVFRRRLNCYSLSNRSFVK